MLEGYPIINKYIDSFPKQRMDLFQAVFDSFDSITKWIFLDHVEQEQDNKLQDSDLDFSTLENPKYAQNKLITQFITPRKNAKLTVDIPKSGTKCVKKIKLNE